MEFDVKKVAEAWNYVWHGNTDNIKEANSYLTEFQTNCKINISIPICEQLFFTENSEKIKIDYKQIAAFSLFQVMSHHFIEISENKEVFSILKNLLYNGILKKLNDANEITCQKICSSVAILILASILNNWENAIKDIINYGLSGSIENCYISMSILVYLSKDGYLANLDQKTVFMIKDKLIYFKEDVLKFIINIVNNLDNLNNQKIKAKFIEKVCECAQVWAKYEINILSNEFLTENFLNIFCENNFGYNKNISDLFCECLSNSESSKIYYNYENTNEGKTILEFIEKKINVQEFMSIKKIIKILFELTKKYIEGINKDMNLFTNMANILSSIYENYIYLLFINIDDISQKLLDMYYYYIAFKKRYISSKFFEGLTELKEFSNLNFDFSQIIDNEQLKEKFVTFLMKITEGIMLNSKLKCFSENYDLILKGEILKIKLGKDKNSEYIDDDFEDDPEEISLVTYRKYSEDALSNIFYILYYKLGCTNTFIQQILNILKNININDPNIVNNTDNLLTVELVFFVITSVIDSLDSLVNETNIISQFINEILNSQLIYNNKIVINFLSFIEQTSQVIIQNEELSKNIINFLLITCKNNLLELACTSIIKNITMHILKPNITIFQIIYETYSNNYDNFIEYTSCYNLAYSLCYSIGIKIFYKSNYNETIQNIDTNDHLFPLSNSDLIKYFSLAMQPATERIIKIKDYLNNNPCQNKVKMEILKDYSVHQSILMAAMESISSNDYNKKTLYYKLFDKHFNETFPITKIIFEKLIKDLSNVDILNELINIYIKNVESLNDKNSLYFERLSKIMIDAFNSSSLYYRCLIILKNLFADYSELSEINNINIANLFFKICEIMRNYIINENKMQIEMIKSFADFFSYVYRKINFKLLNSNNITFNFPQNILDIIKMFNDALINLKEYNLNLSLLNALKTFISNDSINIDIIKSVYNQIIYNIFLCSDIFDGIQSREIIYFISYSLGIFKEHFLNVFKKLLSSENFINLFKNEEYINLIIEYLNNFGDIDSKLQKIITVIIEIKQGRTRLDALNFFGMEIARMKIHKNVGQEKAISNKK